MAASPTDVTHRHDPYGEGEGDGKVWEDGEGLRVRSPITSPDMGPLASPRVTSPMQALLDMPPGAPSPVPPGLKSRSSMCASPASSLHASPAGSPRARVAQRASIHVPVPSYATTSTPGIVSPQNQGLMPPGVCSPQEPNITSPGMPPQLLTSPQPPAISSPLLTSQLQPLVISPNQPLITSPTQPPPMQQFPGQPQQAITSPTQGFDAPPRLMQSMSDPSFFMPVAAQGQQVQQPQLQQQAYCASPSNSYSTSAAGSPRGEAGPPRLLSPAFSPVDMNHPAGGTVSPPLAVPQVMSRDENELLREASSWDRTYSVTSGGGGGGGGFRPISPVDSGSGLQALMAEAQGQATLADAEPGINASLPIPAWYAQQEQGGAAPPIPQPAAAVAKPAPPMGAAVQVTHCTLTESCGLNQTFHMLPKTDVLVLSSVLEDPQVLKMQLAAKGWQTVAQGQMIGVDGQKRITSVVCLKLNNNQIEVVAFEERATCCMATFKFSGQMFRVVGVYVPQQYPEDAAVDLGRWITQCGRKAGCTFIISGLFNYVTSPRVEQVVRAARFRELIRQRPTDIPTKGSLDRVFVARDSTCKLAHPCFPGGRSHAALCCAIPLDGDEGEAAGTLAPAQVVPQVYNPQQASSSIQQVQLLPFAQVPAVPGTTGSPVKAPGAAHAPSAGAAPLPRRSCKVIRLERALRVRFNERHEQRQKGNTEGVATMNREINDIRRKLELVKEAEAASPRGRRK
eukprot:TRINITY_DN830_c2_g1_i2.p1 TRINITY_DN830_c2_g1~~TRINITY_DN830_c2_g1_i2.p1  ORF type:complete len:737 (+),score=151.44 TRINITY_DN830_c2_g1_i2:69-2279(+)